MTHRQTSKKQQQKRRTALARGRQRDRLTAERQTAITTTRNVIMAAVQAGAGQTTTSRSEGGECQTVLESQFRLKKKKIVLAQKLARPSRLKR